jgi:predicted MFS family arabinose efflux permease
MNETETGPAVACELTPHRAVQRLLRLDLTVLGAGFAWFAYIDAPITDGAMRLIAVAVLAGLLCMIAALSCGEAKTERAARRWKRVALWSFVLTTALMLTAATVTLNLKGTGSDESDTQTSVIRPA